MGFLRWIVSAPWRLFSFAIGTVARVVCAVIAAAALTGGAVAWFEWGTVLPGAIAMGIGILLAGRAIS